MKKSAQTVFLVIFAIFTLNGMALRQAQDIAFAGALPDTGQTRCYNDTAEIPCPAPGEDFYGQDAQYTTNPRSYTKLDAGGNDLPDSAALWTMVRDNVTGLIWEVKTDDGSVHDKDNTYTWYDSNPATNGGNAGTPGDGTDTEDFINALNAENFGGYSDWRLPTIKELASITNLGTHSPAIDTKYFSNTRSSYYWSATTYALDTYYAWCVNSYDDGNDDYGNKSDSVYVRGVRSGKTGSVDDLLINDDGTITNLNTYLMWQQQGTDSQMDWKDALAYCEGLSLAGYNDWRLPSREELRSIVDYERYNPAIDIEYFPDTRSSYYWSANTYASHTSSAWLVDFDLGIAPGYGKSGTGYVRAVRTIIPYTHTLTTTILHISGVISRNPNKSEYDHNESVSLTATPESCYDFTNWSGDCSGTSPICTLTMDDDKSVTANFAIIAECEEQVTTVGNNYEVAWSLDGKRLAVTSARNGLRNIWTMNTDGTDELQISNMPSSRGAWGSTYQPNKNQIYYMDNSPSGMDYWWIVRTSIDGEAGRNQVLMASGGQLFSPPRFSPDGSQFCYIHSGTLENGVRRRDIKIADADGSNNHSILHDDTIKGTVLWGKGINSDRLVYTKFVDDVKCLFTIKNDGSEETKITDSDLGDCDVSDWSSDGQKFLFTMNNQIYTTDSEGNDLRQITDDVYENSLARFSPDDERIAYVSKRDETYQIYIRSISSVNNTKSANIFVNPEAGGTVTGNGISCPGDCAESYDPGTAVQLTTMPAECYNFTNWSGACSGTSPTCTLTMNADKSVTANFTVRTHSVSITSNNGTVTKSPNQSFYDCGTTVLLTASPISGYNFDHWEGDATGTQTTASITMTEEMNVTAVFVSGSHIISGYVRDGDNTGISGVTLNFSNSGGTATTNSSGFYTRSVSGGWSGTVTPDKTGYSFDPQNRTYSDVTSNQSDQNYTAALQQQDYVLSGYVRDSNNIGISGVTLTFSNASGSETTNNSGYYTHTISSGWSGTVTPSKQGYTFEPADRSYTAIITGFNQDYTGIPIPFTISGYVRDSGNNGLSGVRLSFSNYAGSAETDSSGYYSHTVYYGWTGTVTPEKSGYTFSPANLSYTNTGSNHTVQNYTGTPTAVPDIAVSPSSLIFTKPTARSGRSGADSHTALPVSQITDRDVSLPTDGKHATGLIIPDHVREHWKTHTPSRKYRSRQNLPASKDWSVYDSPVKNQGYCGSCWAFTTVAMMENLANQANLAVSKDFAEQVLVSCLYSGMGCGGGWYWDALGYIRQNGLPPENCYPYKTSNGNCASKCNTPDFLVKIKDFTPSAGLWGQTGFTAQDLKGALQDGPLCVAMYVADDFYNYSGGIYDYNGGNYEFGHAVLLVGYNDSQQCFKVKNSWGTWWGEGGYFRIAYNDVTDNIKFGCYAVAASGIFVDGEDQTADITVSNTGTASLTVSSISSDKPWLEFSPPTLSALAPNEEKVITLSVGDWNSVASPEETATLTLSSDDPDEASVFVTVKAAIPVMAARPMLMVSPPFYGNISTTSEGKTQIDVSNDSGETFLDVSNGGEGTMSWTTESDNAWLKITQGNTGTDYGKVIIAYEENTGGMRTGTITVSASGAINSPQYVKIRQTDMDVDADDDGMTDSFEFQHGLDPSNPDDASGDRDEDGLTNLEEHEIGTNPNLEDTDDDGMTDGYEAGNGLDPLVYDGDGSSPFTISDAVTALRILAGMNANLAGTNADADENGTVEMKDAVFILQEIAGLR